MGKILLFLFLFSFLSCKTINIEDKKYLISESTAEIGCVGYAESSFFKNSFSAFSIPNLENKIRVDVKILPFNKELNNFYLKKAQAYQIQPKATYVDSLEIKPEFATISIIDVSGYLNEINSEYNKETLNYLKEVKNGALVISVAIALTQENISKIRSSDAYYLTNSDEKKYSLVLYKDNVKTDKITLAPIDLIAYETGNCCWSVNNRGKWYLSDINRNGQSCKGNTLSEINEKQFSKKLNKY